MVKKGTNIIAVQNGVITETSKSPTFGNVLKYKTKDGYEIMYAHLEKTLVKKGDTVESGQVVALSGNSGLSTGEHLHYTIYKNDAEIDPMDFLNLPYTAEVKDEYTKRGVALK